MYLFFIKLYFTLRYIIIIKPQPIDCPIRWPLFSILNKIRRFKDCAVFSITRLLFSFTILFEDRLQSQTLVLRICKLFFFQLPPADKCKNTYQFVEKERFCLFFRIDFTSFDVLQIKSNREYLRKCGRGDKTVVN